MQKEKLAVIPLVIIVVCAISAFLILEYGDAIIKNLAGKNNAIELGDCVDVSYTGRYASNDTIFDSSYNDTTTKIGGTPLKIFVSLNQSELPPEDYETYIHGIEGFIEGIIGLKEGDVKTIGPIPPEKAYGLKPKIGDILNLTPLVGINYIYKFIEIKENQPMPDIFHTDFGNTTTTLYTLREDWHYIGEIVDSYISWENSSVVTKINDTLLWVYTTPSNDINENFTWVEFDQTTGMITYYPENSSSVSFMNDTTITINHNPMINSTVNMSMMTQYGEYPMGSYTVDTVTAEKINVSTTESTGNKSYAEFNRTLTIQRNQTRNITLPDIPGEYLEEVFQYLRAYGFECELSYSHLSDQTLYFEVKIEKVYKTSRK